MNRIAIATALVLASAMGAHAFDRTNDHDSRRDTDHRRVEDNHRSNVRDNRDDRDHRSNDNNRQRFAHDERSDRDGHHRD